MDPLVRGRSLKMLDIALTGLSEHVENLAEELSCQVQDIVERLERLEPVSVDPEDAKERSEEENAKGKETKQERPKKNGKKG